MIERFEKFSVFISEISKYWHKIASEEMEKYGLKGQHSIYLIALERSEEGYTSPELCERCNKDKADVSRMMSIMEKQGLVIKKGTNQNLYNGRYVLTPLGSEAAKKVMKRAALAVELSGGELSDEQREIFYKSLEIINKNLKILSINGLPRE